MGPSSMLFAAEMCSSQMMLKSVFDNQFRWFFKLANGVFVQSLTTLSSKIVVHSGLGYDMGVPSLKLLVLSM